MQFSDSAGKSGIVEDIDFLVNTDSTSYPIAQKTRNINRRYDETVALILQSDGRWKWDDDNQSDSPIGLINLVNSQQNYQIAGGTYLKVQRVEVMDVNGKYYLVYPIDEKEIQNQALTEFQSTAGRPLYYDKLGEEIWLYPKPSSANVTLTSGLKVYYQRPPSYFVTTDTTKVPGFVITFHRILSIGAALDYAIANSMTGKINILMPLLQSLHDGLISHYSSRSGDEKIRLRTTSEDYGAGSNEMTYNNSDKIAFY